MTRRRKAMRYQGDRTGAFHVGQALGPGLDGFYRRVTEVTYDRVRKVTLVVLEPVEVAPDGQRLRYYGDVSGEGAEPEPSIATDDIEPK